MLDRMRYDTWDDFMASQRPLLRHISDFVTAERCKLASSSTRHGPTINVYPASADVMRFTTTPLRDVRVVILGQDPYHGPEQADGLAFSVRSEVTPPPSLRNIFRELESDLRQESGRLSYTIHVNSGDLTPWTRQGVLLLNTALTVRQGEPGSHLSQWQPFTDEVVKAVVDSATVASHFILWGSKAKATFERCAGRLGPGPELI